MSHIPYCDIHVPHSDQAHEPLSFLSGHFNATQSRWSTVEKEAYAIMATVELMQWLASEPQVFDLYTDHNNLIFIFDPNAIQPDLSQTATRKVLRWAVRLSAYTYVFLHISGAENEWADLLSRWAASTTYTIRRLVVIPPLSSTANDDFVWPSPDEIRLIQETHKPSKMDVLSLDNGLWKLKSGQVWIPDDESDL